MSAQRAGDPGVPEVSRALGTAATGGCDRGDAARGSQPLAPTGRGGWRERLGRLPARRGWNTMSRAGGASENSLTQQLGKWVCSLTSPTASAACGRRRPDTRRFPRAGERGGRRDLHVARSRCPLPPGARVRVPAGAEQALPRYLGGTLSRLSNRCGPAPLQLWAASLWRS